MARCEECCKFVSLETDEPEEDSFEVNETRVVGSFTINRNCAECSGLMKTATVELDAEIILSEDQSGREQAVPLCADAHEWEEDGDHDVEGFEEGEGKGRGRKTFFGVEMSGDLKCTVCGAKASFSDRDRVQASAFEEA